MKVKKLTKRMVSRKAFQVWLENLPDRKVISNKHYYSNTCPIAQWLKEITGDSISVGGLTIFTSFGSITTLPWVVKFIEECDHSHGTKNVTKKMALKYLAGMK